MFLKITNPIFPFTLNLLKIYIKTQENNLSYHFSVVLSLNCTFKTQHLNHNKHIKIKDIYLIDLVYCLRTAPPAPALKVANSPSVIDSHLTPFAA